MLSRVLLDVEDAPAAVVQAAGGMIVRRGADGKVEVAIVHRPGRLDWSFPKGKREAGEPLRACALREVFEETGFHCVLGAFVGRTEYIDRKERPKVVHYWLMRRLSGSFVAGTEVDELRWVDFAEANDLLTYERDRDLLPLVEQAALGSLSSLGALGKPGTLGNEAPGRSA